MTVGIPRAFLYHKYYVLWKEFFSCLNVEVVFSPETDREIFNAGSRLSIDEACLPSKIFLGHINYLKDKCDVCFIPRLGGFGRGEDVCVKFNALIDIARACFKDLNILELNIDYPKGQSELKAFLKLGRAMNKNVFSVLNAFKSAKKLQAECDYEKNNSFLNRLNQSEKTKILIVAHPYNALDSFIGRPVERLLNSLGAETLYAFDANAEICRTASKKMSETLYWSFNKELLGALELYLDNVDGVVFLTAFPCGPDSLVNELAMRKLIKLKKPYMNIILDEQQSDTGLETRIESFMDILLSKKNAQLKNAEGLSAYV